MDVEWIVLEHAKTVIDIQGVSLNSFCRPGGLLKIIQQKLRAGDVPIRMLFLNPDREQAYLRAHREYLLSAKGKRLSLDEYKSSGEFQDSQLFKDTTEAIKRMQNIIADEEDRRTVAGLPHSRIDIAKYDSAPHCFMMRVDDSVLVEPYLYGKITPPGKTPAVPGKDMPIFEFPKQGSPLLGRMELRMPFYLLEDHFNFAWDNSERISIY